MERILEDNQPTGEPFEISVPFQVSLDIYTDGWYLQYAVTKKNPAEMNWKNYHSQPLQEHGDLSRVVAYGVDGYSYRMHGGTVGATAYKEVIQLGVRR